MSEPIYRRQRRQKAHELVVEDFDEELEDV